MTNRVVFRTVGLFTCIESYPSAHTTRDEPRGGGSRVRSFATFLGQPLTSARRRGTRARRRQRRRLSRRRRTPPKKSVLFSFFSALRRDRSPRASRRYRSSGGGVGKRRVDRLSRPARAARRERRRAALGPRARRSSRRDERAEVQSRGRGGPVGRRRGDQRAREVDRARGDAPGLGRALQAQREVLEAHIGGGRGVRARAVGPRDVAGKELRLRRARERVQAGRGGGEQNAAARAVRGAPQGHRAHAPRVQTRLERAHG